MWSSGNRHMWKMQWTYWRLQTSAMGLQILSEHMETSGTTNQSKTQCESNPEIPQFTYVHYLFVQQFVIACNIVNLIKCIVCE